MMRLITGVLLITMQVVTSAAQDCKLKKDKDGIKVYACHQDTSAFKQIRAEFDLPNTTRNDLLNFLKRVDHYPEWQYNMVEAKILKSVSENTFVIRSVVDAPWPVSNREMIVQFNATLNNNENKLRMEVKRVPSDYPADPDLVRIPFSLAVWDVSEMPAGTLHVKYVLTVDPGGTVPAWMINMAIAEGPFATFRNLRQELVKE